MKEMRNIDRIWIFFAFLTLFHQNIFYEVGYAFNFWFLSICLFLSLSLFIASILGEEK